MHCSVLTSSFLLAGPGSVTVPMSSPPSGAPTRQVQVNEVERVAWTVHLFQVNLMAFSFGHISNLGGSPRGDCIMHSAHRESRPHPQTSLWVAIPVRFQPLNGRGIESLVEVLGGVEGGDSVST